MKAPQELFESSSTEKYLSEVQRLVSSGERKIDLDFSQCQSVSAYTIARLISLLKDNEGSQTKITITQVQPDIRAMLTALHLDRLLVIN